MCALISDSAKLSGPEEKGASQTVSMCSCSEKYNADADWTNNLYVLVNYVSVTTLDNFTVWIRTNYYQMKL